MHITITGNLGSGKSTVAKLIESRGFERVSTGEIQRKIAESMGITTLELLERSKTDNSIDDMIDGMVKKMGAEEKAKNIVFESRLAWHFVEDSLKVFIKCDLDESARRVLEDERKSESYNSLEECKEALNKRMETEKHIFNKIYRINLYDLKNYDLVIDSTNATPEQMVEQILKQVQNRH